MQMNYKVAGQFENMYPVTLGDNVNLNTGQTLEQWKSYVEDLLNNIDSGQVEIWTGNNILGTSGSGITLSKSLNSSKNGWILVFKDVSGDTNYNYCYVPKVHPPGKSVKFVIGGSGGSVYSKYLYISNTTINGHSSNGASGNERMELIRVISY